MNKTATTLIGIWATLKGRTKTLLCVSAVLFATVTASRIATPISFAWIVTATQNLSGGVMWGALTYALLFLFTRFVEEMRFATYVAFEQEVQRSLALRTIDVFFRIPFSASREKSASENAISVDRGLGGLRSVLYNATFSLAPLFLETGALLIIIGVRVNWAMAAWTLLIIVLFLWVTMRLSDRTRKLQEKWFATASRMYKILFENLRSYESIRSFDQVAWARQRYSNATDGFVSEVLTSLRPGIILGAAQGGLLAVLVGSMIAAVLVGESTTVETVATLVLVNGLLLQIVSPLLQFSFSYSQFIQGLASARQLLDLLKLETVPTKIRHGILERQGEFYAANLSVNFGGADILQIPSLAIPMCKLVVICGASGAGKSTLARCLAGLMEYDGTIHARLPSDHTFLLSQDVHIFDIPLEENIALGLPVDTERMEWALTKAGLSAEERRSLYDRGIGESGANVSGGQRQRIGIARMLYHDAAVLILDEPTSSLDPENTNRVLHTLKEVSRERTCIVVTHDERCLAVADIVIEIHNGNAVVRQPEK